MLVPLGVLAFALAIRMRPAAAARTAINVGAALIGFFALFHLFASIYLPLAHAVAARTGLPRDRPDLGVFSLLAATWGSPLAIFFLPVGLLVNFVLLRLGATRTLAVDLLNYWTWGVSAVAVYALSGNVGLALAAFVINELAALFVADRSARRLREHYELEGVAVAHAHAALWVPAALIVDAIVARIPGLRRIDIDPARVLRRGGPLAQPAVIAVIVAAIVGILARERLRDVLELAVVLAGSVLVFPYIMRLFIEGMGPLAQHVRERVRPHVHKDALIGVDAAVMVGSPDVLAVGMLLIPLVFALGLLLPSSRVLPLADLAVATPFLVTMCVPFAGRGNVFRSLLTGLVVFVVSIYVAGDLAPLYAKAGVRAGMSAGTAGSWTSLGAGGSWLTWLLVRGAKLLGY